MWADNKIGKKPTRQIAAELNKSPRSVVKWIKDFDTLVKESIEYQQAGKAIIKMIPKAVKTYDKSMNNRTEDGNVDMVGLRAADNVFKITGILIERRKDELTGKDGGPIQVDLAEVKENLKKNLAGFLAGNTTNDDQNREDDESR